MSLLNIRDENSYCFSDTYKGIGRVGFAETGSTRFAPEAPAGLRPTGDDPARGERIADSIPSGPFGVILADPPWAFKTWSGKHATPHRTANDHYVTRKVSALAELPVLASAARDCVLFMWTVDSHIDEAIELGKAWGFKFKTRAFTWRKLTKDRSRARISMGYWTRKQTEICLLFTRGAPKRLSKGVREIIDAPIREHSRKPDEQYERIEALVAGPYLELFARQTRDGWESWGDQVGKYPAKVDGRRMAETEGLGAEPDQRGAAEERHSPIDDMDFSTAQYDPTEDDGRALRDGLSSYGSNSLRDFAASRINPSRGGR
jgi:N6-adenosine-specific RNA methylase IME4